MTRRTAAVLGTAALLALLAAVSALAASAAPAPAAARAAADLTGTWKGFSGTLTLVQQGAQLTGTFAMAVGCTRTYNATGSVSGSTVSLALALPGGSDGPPCAATQTMSGTAGASALQLALVNEFQSSPPTAFTRVGAPPASCAGTRATIAFQSERDGNAEIYVMAADGRSQARCTSDPAFDGQPVWAPDGTELAIRSDRSGNPDIWLLPLVAGEEPENLTRHPAVDEDPSWSPDGSRIVFSSTRSGDRELWVLTVDTGAVRRLTASPGYDGDPAWSPDGRWIAWERGSTTQGLALWVMRADGTGARKLTSSPGRFDLDPAWTPDARRIVFNSSRSGVNQVWTVAAADGSGAKALTATAKANVLPAVSPDGRRIAFATLRYGAYEIAAMTAAGGAVTRLTANAAHDLAPDWRRR